MCWDCFRSREDADQSRRNGEIDKRIDADRKVDERIVKLLLLGSGESGKSTFIKQLKIIKGEGFDGKGIRDEYIPVIRSNLLQATKSILGAMAILCIDFASQEAKEAKMRVLDVLGGIEDQTQDELLTIDPNCLQNLSSSIITLWHDEGFRNCFSRSNEYQLMDSAKYYLDKAGEICCSTFKPSDQDILRSRKKTTSIIEYIFDIKKVRLKVIDVGGQRRERRKWISCFDNITSIIFLSSLSDYDLKLQESSDTNRMQESLELFSTILDYPWFKKKSIILFLNKTDLFEEKILVSNIRDHFPAFTGPTKDAQAGKEFIRSLFEAKQPNLDGSDTSHIFPHFTCATDTDNISKVFKDVQEIILRTYLNEFNLV